MPPKMDPFASLDDHCFTFDGIDDVFIDQDEFNQDRLASAEHINLDLIEFHNFSNENVNSQLNISLVGEYFDKRSSSLVDLTAADNNQSAISRIKPSPPKPTAKVESSVDDLRHQNGFEQSVSFTTICYSEFRFDFLKFVSAKKLELQFQFQFPSREDCRRKFSFAQKLSKLILHADIERCENIASLIPYECGDYLVKLCVFPYESNRMTSTVPYIINCSLQVRKLTLFRPISHQQQIEGNNDIRMIELNYLENDDSPHWNIFFKTTTTNANLFCPFVLKVCIERPCETLTFAESIITNHKIGYHLINPWTCLVSVYCASDFNVRLRFKPTPNDYRLNFNKLLAIYTCDSFEDNKSFLICYYNVKLCSLEPIELQESCIQSAVSDLRLYPSKWKRIDFRNRDSVAHVKVNIRITYGGRQLDERSGGNDDGCGEIKCSQSQFVLKPLARESIIFAVNKSILENLATAAAPSGIEAKTVSGNDSPPRSQLVNVFIDQFGGVGKKFTSLIQFRLC